MHSLYDSLGDFWKICLVFIAVVLFFIVLKELKFVFMPLAFSVILGFLLSPMITKLREKGIPSFVIIIGLILILLVVFTGVGFMLYHSTISVINGIGAYEDNINTQVNNLIDLLGLEGTQWDWGNLISAADLRIYALRAIDSFTTVMGYIMLVIILTSFLLASRLTFFNKLSRTLSRDKAYKIKSIYNKIELSVQTYLYTKIMISIITALVCAIIMILFRVDFVFILATIIFLFNFIPNIGSIVATSFPIILYFLKYGFTYQFIALILLLWATQFTFGNLVEPRWAGRGLNLSPILIILSLFVWYYVWGISGMLIAVPLLSIIKIVFEHIDFTRKIAKFMGAD
jgi:predicted PurR-regulated permease PerM